MGLYATEPTKASTSSVRIGKITYKVELAKTEAEQAQGLMFRKNLPKCHGMLFILRQEKYAPFWMKNTLVPLDMLWINRDKVIVSIREHAVPEDTTPLLPSEKALYVLEIPSGDVNAYRFKLGQKVTLQI